MGSDPDLVGLVYRSCRLLDENRFDEWLALCAPDFHYRITAYSTEIRKEMEWLSHDVELLKTRFDDLPNHVVVKGTYRRHASMCEEVERANGIAKMDSSVVVYHTNLSGASRLFAVVRYGDTIALGGETPLLAERVVRMETRSLEFSPTIIL